MTYSEDPIEEVVEDMILLDSEEPQVLVNKPERPGEAASIAMFIIVLKRLRQRQMAEGSPDVLTKKEWLKVTEIASIQAIRIHKAFPELDPTSHEEQLPEECYEI